eukprot:CAMPEP_0175774310 /NCGR_PEP_ID=MMETSP0097-20121207/73539_1 /TAXON_ID=311494 /ORGANISM="Alexandrium monilatum, Strain CCMP3105" /LENGTH=54 /DNA_ID=CAMNT_0017084771 /DNA_START=115 /DNA_END=276 /DNA_ORIENTATION=-
MIGCNQPRKGIFELGRQAAGLLHALLPLALLHGQNDAEARGALGLAERLQRLLE